MSEIRPDLAPTPSDHCFAYRISSNLFGERYYVTIFAGPDRRSLHRVSADGQLRSSTLLIFKAFVFLCLSSGLFVIAFVSAFIVAYLAKTALGIDVLEGDSAFHSLVF